MDADGLAVFEGKEVRHEVLVKINKLALWVLALDPAERSCRSILPVPTGLYTCDSSFEAD